MKMSECTWKFVVWERLNKTGKWCPYSPVVSQYLEQNFKKEMETVSLENADENLKIYDVNLKDMIQTSSTTGTKCQVRRHLCGIQSIISNGYTWQWSGDHGKWYSYDIDVSNFVEEAFKNNKKSVTLKKAFRGYNYEIDFKNMIQINKQTKRKRPIRRQQDLCPYPVIKEESVHDERITDDKVTNASCSEVHYSRLTEEIPGTSELLAQVNEYARNAKRSFLLSDPKEMNGLGAASPSGDQNTFDAANVQNSVKETSTVALVNGRPWYNSRPPHTSQTQLKPVPGIDPLTFSEKKKKRKKKVKKESLPIEVIDVMKEYTVQVESTQLNSKKDEECIICCESLENGSSYDGSTAVIQLKLCPHIFHQSCLLAMYNSGPKDNCLQCPVCKKIHGVKCGIQPPGDMIFHVIPYSLPGFSECDTIRIIYDIPSGTQGPEHPNPGKKYTSRGFPRHCYLPDNEIGRKILRLLAKAWHRRLIFTIGRSSTTGEEDTVTWNEIHHKTEFGFNRRGHGYPDPNYFENVISELEAHGVKDDDVYLWYPA